MTTAEPTFLSVSKRGTISLPPAVRRRFHLDQPGAQVQLTVNSDGTVIELRPHVAVPADQAWYWTPEWQEGERRADESIARGEGVTLYSHEEFEAWLDSH